MLLAFDAPFLRAYCHIKPGQERTAEEPIDTITERLFRMDDSCDVIGLDLFDPDFSRRTDGKV
ncbi:hypothetical protein DEV91_11985 [Phyllobacterium brassicacearum]|nr:hypothetical protein DEV91_11985 [Phyllobacterium brassicacearum]